MRRVIPIAEPEFIITPLLQVPPASRGEPSRAPTRFPLLAGGTLRRGSLLSLIFANYGCAIGISSTHTPQPSPCAGRESSDKGTTARHGISAAGAVFPSASANRQALPVALTPFVPLSRQRERGKAGRTAVRPCTPLPQRGRGAGGEGRKACVPCTQRTQAVYPYQPAGGGNNSSKAQQHITDGGQP